MSGLVEGNAATALKQRLQADMRAAMKAGRRDEVKVLRTLASAIDQAEAPAAKAGPVEQHDFAAGTAEIARLDLGAEALRTVLAGEIAEREAAAQEFVRLGLADRADSMRAEADIARRYLEQA